MKVSEEKRGEKRRREGKQDQRGKIRRKWDKDEERACGEGDRRVTRKGDNDEGDENERN